MQSLVVVCLRRAPGLAVSLAPAPPLLPSSLPAGASRPPAAARIRPGPSSRGIPRPGRPAPPRTRPLRAPPRRLAAIGLFVHRPHCHWLSRTLGPPQPLTAPLVFSAGGDGEWAWFGGGVSGRGRAARPAPSPEAPELVAPRWRQRSWPPGTHRSPADPRRSDAPTEPGEQVSSGIRETPQLAALGLRNPASAWVPSCLSFPVSRSLCGCRGWGGVDRWVRTAPSPGAGSAGDSAWRPAWALPYQHGCPGR